MRVSMRCPCLVLSLVVFSLAALPALAGEKIYMQIQGPQGEFHGEGTKAGSPWIAVLSVNESVVSPRDASTGMASGKRQHQPLVITKEVGPSSKQLHDAMTRGELLRKVTIEFVRTDAGGKEQVYRAIELTNAQVSGIEMRKSTGGMKNANEVEEIKLAYQKIEFKSASVGKASDKWQNPR